MRLLQRHWLRWPSLLSLSLLLLMPPAAPSRPPTKPQALVGTIAYVRPGGQQADEIWLIEPDGSHNRRLWTVGQPDPNNIVEIWDLDWRPDAAELAFASDHEQTCSLDETDLFAIQPDGTGYRRITNSPACAALASYPKGAVSVTVRNFSTRNPLDVYVQGAPGTQTVVVSQGTAATVTFPDVADLGDGVVQQGVVIWIDRWFSPTALGADVKPGQTVPVSGTLDIAGAGTEHAGASIPSWHSDGTRLGFIFNVGEAMGQIPAQPAPNERGTYLLAAQKVFARVLDWGPTPALANQLLYWIQVKDGVGDGGIYQVTEGSADRGVELIDTGIEEVIDLQWLPDGSGFLFTKIDNFRSSANVYHYDLGTSDQTQLTQFTSEYTIDVSVSPDSQWIVFERAPTLQLTSGDLWLMRRDGTELQRLVENGLRPSWSAQASPPTATPSASPSPTLLATPSPSATFPAVQNYLPVIRR